mgnify:CR=1 FL=1
MEELQRQFETLFAEYSDAIFRHLYYRLGERERAKELTQEVFMRTWQHVAAGKKLDYPKAFLYTVANRLFINEIRTDRAHRSLESLTETSDFDVVEAGVGPVGQAEEKELLDKLGQLSPEDRDVLIFRYIDGLAVQEIAELRSERPNTISMRIARALDRLREIYGSTKQ